MLLTERKSASDQRPRMSAGFAWCGSQCLDRTLVSGLLTAVMLLLGFAAQARAQTYENSRGLYGGMTISIGWNKWAEESGTLILTP